MSIDLIVRDDTARLRRLITAKANQTSLEVLGDLGTGSGFAVPYPGYRQRVTRKATGLFTLLVNGVGLPLNGWADYEFDGSVRGQTAGGGIL